MNRDSEQLAAVSLSHLPAHPSVQGASAAYWEKRLQSRRGLEGVGFTDCGRPFNEWMYRVRKRVFLDQIAKLPLELAGARVLDIGSGTGFWAEVWKSLGVKSLTASDITNIASQRLSAAYPEYRVLRLDISSPEAIDVLRSRYDVVSAIDVFFHIVSDDAYASALSNVSLSLNCGGYFMFTENMPHRELARSKTQVNRTLEKVDEAIQKAGMRMIKRVPMFVLMNTPFDTRWHSAVWFWRLFMKPLSFLPWLGHLYGAALYPLECVLLKTFVEGPSTEFIICQKVQST